MLRLLSAFTLVALITLGIDSFLDEPCMTDLQCMAYCPPGDDDCDGGPED